LKNITVALSVIIFLCCVFLNTTTAQTNQQIENKKWSRIIPDNKVVIPLDPNYKYISPPQVPQRYFLSETDAVVQANYRVLPTTNTTQSELSIDIHPTNPNILFAGSNGTSWPVSGVYGTGIYWTTNSGTTWTGSDNPAPYFGTDNSGDPAAVIGTNGYFYMGYIDNPGGQGISRSTNNGVNWTSYTVTPLPGAGGLADKNHLMIDKKVGSTFENRLYAAWTDFGGVNEDNICLKYSTDLGQTWSVIKNISDTLNSFNQGVNIQTGPNGEVYATWSMYDGTFDREDAIGFAKSTNGGVTWEYKRIYGALTPNASFNFGIRGYLKTSSIRVASFPSMTVDRSGGPRNGYIYICWPQRGVSPAGSDPDIVMIRSTNGGTQWSSPVRVNNDALSNGKDQYYPWCAVDQSTGQLHVVFYDNRNTTSDSTGVFMATSSDGGLSFDNYKVSDANFKPKPISGLAGGYQGDYIGITAANGKAYPFWADDRTGNYQAWTSIVTFGPSIVHTQLTNTENIAGPYAVNATITSINPLVTSSIKVYWGRGVGVLNDSLTMTNTGGNNFTANIPGNGTNATYNYYLSVTDNQGTRSKLPSNAPAGYFTFTAQTDVTPPLIVHTPLMNLPSFSFPPIVTANVSDNIGVQSVICEYRKNGGVISNFNLPLLSGSTYQAIFPSIGIVTGDVIEYRIKATDISAQQNIAFNPTTGFHSFTIITSLGNILVVDDDLTLLERASSEKGGSGDQLTPLGASANLFTSSLTAAGYTVSQVTFSAINTSTLSSYDVVILSAGIKESTMFNDLSKRTALVNYTLAGGKTLVEGGEVGYVYRNAGTTDLHPAFRRNLLLDSVWVSDRTSANLQLVATTHPIFNIPNSITSPITINNGGTSGWGARDEMTVLPGVTGVSRIANWVGGTVANGGIFIYSPNGDTSKCRNIFYAFSVAQFANQSVAGNLIVNSVRYLMREFIPTNKTLTITALIEGLWNGTTLVSDTLTVEFRNSSSPFNLVESKRILLNSNGSGTNFFALPSENTPYYMVIKHRNSVETWSNSTVQFASGNLFYDFTTDQSKAYGNNLKLVNGKWCIYSGDVNQDGFIDINDQSQVFVDNISGGIGYISSDLNGDLFTEISDLNLVFVNRVLGVSRQKPPLTIININSSN